MSEPRTWASVHKEWLGDGSLMNGYTKRGLSYATGEMAWNASRAALLADAPDVEGLVKELREVGWYAESQIDDIIDALLSQAARIKALKEENAKLKGHAENLIRRLGEIADWRREAHEYDADMDYEPRTFCEDVELIEQAAQDAIEAYRRDHPEEGT